MPSPDDRLQELRRQRALVQEQLTFLDREIAAASGQATSLPAAQNLQSVPAGPIPPATPPADGGEVGELIESLEDESRSNLAKAKWGCIWTFVAGLVLFALCVFAFYSYVKLHQSAPVR
ncbi:MAG TPA: hypothetical protein VNV15_04165 [Opitutaceae bacterium]|jgi:hypothetical protein|nr:hypothetical protein [Opitutaceae bacterium]